MQSSLRVRQDLYFADLSGHVLGAVEMTLDYLTFKKQFK